MQIEPAQCTNVRLDKSVSWPDRHTAVPTDLEIFRVEFTAVSTGDLPRAAAAFKLANDVASTRRITLVFDPHLGPCLGEWNLTHATLRVLIEDSRRNACLRQQGNNEMRIWQRRRGVDSAHQSCNLLCPVDAPGFGGCECRKITRTTPIDRGFPAGEIATCPARAARY